MKSETEREYTGRGRERDKKKYTNIKPAFKL